MSKPPVLQLIDADEDWIALSRKRKKVSKRFSRAFGNRKARQAQLVARLKRRRDYAKPVHGGTGKQARTKRRSFAKHTPGGVEHDQSEHGNWSDGTTSPGSTTFNPVRMPDRPFTVDEWLSSDKPPWDLSAYDIQVEGRTKTGLLYTTTRGTVTASNRPDHILVTDKFFELSREGRKQVLLHEYGHDLDGFLTGPENGMETFDAWERGVFRNADGVTIEGHSRMGEAIADAYAAIVGSEQAVQFYIDRGWQHTLEYVADAAQSAGMLPQDETPSMKLLRETRAVAKHLPGRHNQLTHGRRGTRALGMPGEYIRGDVARKGPRRDGARTLDHHPPVKDHIAECYSNAGRFLIHEASDADGVSLVHGVIRHPTGHVAHAWVELPDEFIYEPTTDAVYHPEDFERLFDPLVIIKYPRTAAISVIAGNQHWGPYDEVSEDWYDVYHEGVMFQSHLEASEAATDFIIDEYELED